MKNKQILINSLNLSANMLICWLLMEFGYRLSDLILLGMRKGSYRIAFIGVLMVLLPGSALLCLFVNRTVTYWIVFFIALFDLFPLLSLPYYLYMGKGNTLPLFYYGLYVVPSLCVLAWLILNHKLKTGPDNTTDPINSPTGEDAPITPSV